MSEDQSAEQGCMFLILPGCGCGVPFVLTIIIFIMVRLGELWA